MHLSSLTAASLLAVLTGCRLDTLGDAATCDTSLQDCPSGKKCTYGWDPDLWTVAACVPLRGSKAFDEECTGYWSADSYSFMVDDCATGLHCSNGRCAEFCTSEQECPASRGLCDGSLGNGVYFCDDCNPLDQDCPESQQCLYRRGRFECTPISDHSLGLREECVPDDEAGSPCAKGLHCSASSGVGCSGPCCVPFCSVGVEDPSCLQGEQCIELADDEYAWLGLCSPL